MVAVEGIAIHGIHVLLSVAESLQTSPQAGLVHVADEGQAAAG